MKYFLYILFFTCISSIIAGYILEINYSEKLIGFGVLGLFLIFFPLFTYYSWKNKDIKDYMLTKENLEKMRKREGDNRKL
ncbi:hypothetical protein Q4512_06095 [Oceanihabitans sp. 2_MG-2023]|uniref:hypothetical protein n=1 Tax=Oceanihabitans sp. 2_MG-2023 TaxID=3062661 RepID=UPI0026E42680|nr:hypothetical protein [Oceanihabitans sp. 2_MG-2023]MDO6596477.1 hypothetical protein [Oceanihabitans sp. 2_MG-2023]